MAALFALRLSHDWTWAIRGARLAFLIVLLVSPPLSQATEPKRAQLTVSGYGLLGNRQLKQSLQLLGDPGKKPEFFDANFVEDSALILMSRLNRDGFLKPELIAHLV